MRNQHTLTISSWSGSIGLLWWLGSCRRLCCGFSWVRRALKVAKTFAFVHDRCKVFCEAVTVIVGAAAPEDTELFLTLTITNPAESHVHSFGTTLFDSVVGDACGGVIVRYDDGRRLWMLHFDECLSFCCCLFSVVEEAPEFRFGGTRHDVFQDVADNEDCSINFGEWIGRQWWNVWRHVTETMVPTDA